MFLSTSFVILLTQSLASASLYNQKYTYGSLGPLPGPIKHK